MTHGTGLAPALDYHVVNSLGWPDLRPLQRAAVEPIRAGADCLLLAPTAGGKTEAAFFPLLSQITSEQWPGLSVLYVTPLRALLNNLAPRLAGYGSWVGREVGLWHGDTGQGERKRLLADPPAVLLTTPESLEAMLVSRRVDHRYLFAGLRAVVVDELHAFAGDDRGWHLLAVLERLQVLAGRRIQRIGLSATIGNPQELLTWLQGGTPAARAEVVSIGSTGPVAPVGQGVRESAAVLATRGPVVDPDAADPSASDLGPTDLARTLPSRVDGEVTLDYVGSVDNAATVISRLHAGEKRLVFCESRAQVEDLARALREREVLAFVSHSSLSRDERRRSELAFAEARDCVVVATSTLELGIDVGDLDRVIQLDAPASVASFLQRLGRSGRRPGSHRNTLFLATRDDALVQSAALLTLWRDGFVEPVAPPPNPQHIIAQQFLALVLQEGRIGLRTWPDWWPDWVTMAQGQRVLDYLVSEGFLAVDSGLAFVGDAAERHFGRRNFIDLTAVFTADPELMVTVGRKELGTVSPLSLGSSGSSGSGEGPTILSLAGRSWRVVSVDWAHRQVAVVADETRGRSHWLSGGAGRGISAQMAGAVREVLLGRDAEVDTSRRAVARMRSVREERQASADVDGIVLQRDAESSHLWTFAGTRINNSLAAALVARGIEARAEPLRIVCDEAVTVPQFRSCAAELDGPAPPQPRLDQDMLDGLKFSAALPESLARQTLAERLTDPAGAAAAARGPVVIG